MFKVNLIVMSVINCKPKNEFDHSPPWRGAGVGLKKIFTFLVYNLLPVGQIKDFKQVKKI